MNKSINPIKATVTTYRSQSAVSFFDAPQDATPQDCLTVTSKLLNQSTAVLYGVLNAGNLPSDTVLQIQSVLDGLQRAGLALSMVDIDQAVKMATREQGEEQ